MAANIVPVVLNPMEQLHADKLVLINERNALTKYIGGSEKSQQVLLRNRKKDKTTPPTPELHRRMEELIRRVQGLCEGAGLVLDGTSSDTFLRTVGSALSQPSSRNQSAQAFNLHLSRILSPYFEALLEEEERLQNLGRVVAEGA